MLKEAKLDDYFIVGLQTDSTLDCPVKNRPDQTVVERLRREINQKEMEKSK